MNEPFRLPMPGMLPGRSDKRPPGPSVVKPSVEGWALYDPELLYVECRVCGKPVLWDYGKTTELLFSAGVDFTLLDAHCLILSDGCPACQPRPQDGYMLAVVRLAGLGVEEPLRLLKSGGVS